MVSSAAELRASSRDTYLRAFKEVLSFYGAGLNALALQIRIDLAHQHADWGDQFDDEQDALRESQKERELAEKISGALAMAIESEQARSPERADFWLSISAADVALLTGKPVKRVVRLYRRALDGTAGFEVDVVRGQPAMYRDLACFERPPKPSSTRSARKTGASLPTLLHRPWSAFSSSRAT